MVKEYSEKEFKNKKNIQINIANNNIWGRILGSILAVGILSFLILLIALGIKWAIKSLFG